MKHEILRTSLPNKQLQTPNNFLPQSNFFKAAKLINNCNFRTGNGFCTRSNRQCTATLFTEISNN